MRSTKYVATVLAATAALGIAACGSSSKSSTTGGASTTGSAVAGAADGAGSTFAEPIYQQWGSTLKGQDGITVNYQGVGSGAGIAELTQGTVAFAGSDPPMKDDEVKAAEQAHGSTPVHFPIAFGAITLSYNLPGVKSGLKLDGKAVADIFLGKVTKWNDAEIAKLNPGLNLPGQSITVVHRSDASGTTKGFTGWLAAVSPEWASKVGSDKSVKWPTGTGAKGNNGVAAAVKQTPGAVGYVEQAYALQNGFTTADVKNAAGKFVAPTLESTSAAGEGLKVPADLRFAITNPTNPTAYPITSQTFLIVYQDICKAGQNEATAKRVKKLVEYALGSGQDVLTQLSYAKLPSALLTEAQAKIGTLQCNGSPIAG